MIKVYCTIQQAEVVTCKARYIGLFAGRRFGKTLGVIVPRIVRNCMGKAEFRVAYVAASYKLVRQVYDTINNVCRALIADKMLQPTPRIVFLNGSSIDFYSWGNAEGLRGWGYDELICDEIQDMSNEDLFWAVMRPLVSDRQGTILVAGQFRGMDWRYKMFCERGGMRFDGKKWIKETPKPGYRAFVIPASDGPTYQSERGKQDLQDAKDQLPRIVFQQEYECIPTANKAAVFSAEDIEACTKGQAPDGPMPNRAYVLAADLGWFADPTKWVVLEWPTLLVADAGAEPLRQKHEVTALKLAQVRKKWRCGCVVIDSTAGAGGGHHKADEFLKFYRKTIPDVRHFIFTQATKADMYKAFSIYVEGHKLSIPACWNNLINEMQTLEYEHKGGDRYDIHGAEGYHDDYPAALGMAIQMVERGQVGGSAVSVGPG